MLLSYFSRTVTKSGQQVFYYKVGLPDRRRKRSGGINHHPDVTFHPGWMQSELGATDGWILCEFWPETCGIHRDKRVIGEPLPPDKPNRAPCNGGQVKPPKHVPRATEGSSVVRNPTFMY
ncbi:jg1679 [Pararge aegeria aegeria]|uniref:Jg1679 protein n=1 Tax=Pararge aegeria aegeria TaxID=348720 RepID=A0A8S4RGF5_9NEOP|nr:jg1679 [Pararge aegeria aegeria]